MKRELIKRELSTEAKSKSIPLLLRVIQDKVAVSGQENITHSCLINRTASAPECHH